MSNGRRNTLSLTAAHHHCRGHQQNYNHFSSNPKSRRSHTADWCAWGVKWSIRQNVSSWVWGREDSLENHPFVARPYFSLIQFSFYPYHRECTLQQWWALRILQIFPISSANLPNNICVDTAVSALCQELGSAKLPYSGEVRVFSNKKV